MDSNFDRTFRRKITQIKTKVLREIYLYVAEPSGELENLYQGGTEACEQPQHASTDRGISVAEDHEGRETEKSDNLWKGREMGEGDG